MTEKPTGELGAPMSDNQSKFDDSQVMGSEAKKPWLEPDIVTFQPAAAAEGVSYNPTDGLTNLTPG